MGEFGSWPTLDGATGPRERDAGRDEHRVHFVCTGNIARSASAELLARARFDHVPLTFDSSGVGGLRGRGVAGDVRGALESRGLDGAGHRPRQTTGAMLDASGLILAMDRSHRTWVLDEWPGLVTRIALLGEAAEVAASTDPAALDTGGAPVAEWLVRHCTHQARFEVVDPYQRGPEAGEAAVAQIERALDVLVPWYAAAVSRGYR